MQYIKIRDSFSKNLKNMSVNEWLKKKLLVYGHDLVGIYKPFRYDMLANVFALHMTGVLSVDIK